MLFFFLPSADFFQNKLFEKKSFRNTIRMSNSLDLIRPDDGLGPNCLPRSSADDSGRQRVNMAASLNILNMFLLNTYFIFLGQYQWLAKHFV